MFNRKPDPQLAVLETVIADAQNEILKLSIVSDEYAKATKRLAELYALKSTTSRRISPDTIAMVTANLAGIILILGHERAHVVTSKALSFVGKLK